MPNDQFPPPGYFLQIKDWDTYFERAQTRRIEGPLSWVAIPTKQDGLKFSRLLARQNGLQCLCAFILLVEIGAKCVTRGVFLGSGHNPLTVRDFARITGVAPRELSKALEVLISNEIGWIELIPLDALSPSSSTEGSDMREEKNREEKRRIDNSAVPTSPDPKKPRDARLDSPVIQVVRDILGKYPNKLVWDEIIEKTGESFDESRLRHCAKEWAKVTSNMFNLTWVFEWYVNGIPERKYGNGKSDQQVHERGRDSAANSGGDRSQFVRKPKPVV